MIFRILDRYLLREWVKIFVVTAIGFPVMVIVIEIVDNLSDYLARGLSPGTIAQAYIFSLPDKIFLILPAAVLFATVFALGAMSRHSELAAAKASGRSLYRMFLPILFASTVAAGSGFVIGEVAPPATRKHLELLGELETRSTGSKYNFVYRAEQGWTYAIRVLEASRNRMRDIILEREGTGPEYPTLAIQAANAVYDTATTGWTLSRGRFRIIPGSQGELSMAFDSMRMRSLVESPDGLLIEPKKPQEMRYAELGAYIDALVRSGGDGRQLSVERALKIAVPFTCIIIAIFAAPLVVSAPRATGAFGIAVSLGTTVVFLLLVQLSRAIGSGGGISPELAAWLPNALFGVVGVVLMIRAPT